MSASQAQMLHEGVNDPSPITRVLALGWFDGPVEGVLQLGERGPAFRFNLLDQKQQADTNDVRAYGLYVLPADALSRLSELLSAFAAPRWPVWCPAWKFPDDQIRRRIDEQTQDLLQRAGPLAWIVVGDLAQPGIRALRVVARAG